MVKNSVIGFVFLLVLATGRNAFSAPSPSLIVPGAGIIFEAGDRYVLVFRRDKEAKAHVLKYTVTPASKLTKDVVLSGHSNALATDSSGTKIFWFSHFGGTFSVLDLETGKERQILQKKPEQKGFWIDPPYRLSFAGPEQALAYGYLVDEKGIGGEDGVYAIDLKKEGLDALSLVVSKEELLKAALPRTGKWASLTLHQGDSLLYGITSKNLVDLLQFNMKTRKALYVDSCAFVGKAIFSEDEKELAYDCIKPNVGEEIHVYSAADGKNKVAASGPYRLLDLSPTGESLVLARVEGKQFQVGVASRKNQFKFVLVFTSPNPFLLDAKFVASEKIVLIRNTKGLWLAPIPPTH